MWISTNSVDSIDSTSNTGLGCPNKATLIDLPKVVMKTTGEISTHPLSQERGRDSGSLAMQLDALMEIEGGGTWPPRLVRPQASSSSSTLASSSAITQPAINDTSDCSWWQSYHTLALSLAATGRFVDSEDGLHPSRSEAYLRAKIDDNRSWMAEEVNRVVVVDMLMRRLNEALAIDGHSHSSASCLGLFACLMYLAHLYRWGILPVVSLAQDERTLEMPEAIARPLKALSERYGLKTSGGCLWTMTLLNVDPETEDGIVYANMRHLRDTYPDAWDAERLNAMIFYDMERLALPFYRAIATLEDKSLEDYEIIDSLRIANASLKAAFKLFFDTVREGRIKKDVWMSHAQGFHGWGIDEYDGVSGDHSLLIRTLDAFLAIPTHTGIEASSGDKDVAAEPRATNESIPSWSSWIASMVMPWRWRSKQTPTPLSPPPPPAFSEVPYSDDYLPTQQAAWTAAVRAANLRPRLARAAPEELEETVRILRLWRAAHTRKAVYYENLDLPERRPMTASGGVGGGVGDGKTEDVGEMIRKLEARLKARIEATR